MNTKPLNFLKNSLLDRTDNEIHKAMEKLRLSINKSGMPKDKIIETMLEIEINKEIKNHDLINRLMFAKHYKEELEKYFNNKKKITIEEMREFEKVYDKKHFG